MIWRLKNKTAIKNSILTADIRKCSFFSSDVWKWMFIYTLFIDHSRYTFFFVCFPVICHKMFLDVPNIKCKDNQHFIREKRRRKKCKTILICLFFCWEISWMLLRCIYKFSHFNRHKINFLCYKTRFFVFSHWISKLKLILGNFFMPHQSLIHYTVNIFLLFCRNRKPRDVFITYFALLP